MNAEPRAMNNDVDSEESSAGARPPTAPATMTLRLRKKTLAIIVAVDMVAMLAAYGVGRMHASEQVDRIKAQADQELKAMISQNEDTSRKLQAAVQRSQLLEARRQVHLALLALDARNFGTAGEHLQDAHKLVETSAAPSESELGKLGRDLGQPDVVKVTEDIGEQRDRILGMARLMDKLIAR